MASTSQRSKGPDAVLSRLDIAIQFLSAAKDACSVAPAQIALGSACALLMMIRDTISNKQGFIDLGLFCARVCEALDRGLNGNKSDQLSDSMLKAIEQLTTTIGEIQKRVEKKSKQHRVSGFLHAKSDKEAIAGWRQEFDDVLKVFSIEMGIGTHVGVAELLAIQGGAHSIQVSTPPGELPPPAPKAFFGRDTLIDEVVAHAERLESTALVGAGGIGKTSIALTVLQDNRIKARFGDNRRFVRCDQFPASLPHFLARLSKVIGAGVENPEDLAPLRPFLSSKDTLIVLDNAESILDPQGPNHQEIYTAMNELCQFETVCLCITSRIRTVPRYCKRPQIPTLSKEAACEIFYGIYGDGERSGIIDDLLQRLDFHALSITLLATTASDNAWDHDRLVKEWDTHRAQALRTDHNESLAATIELSLTSPTFHKLGPDARDLLGVVAFFPQGIDENNLDWFFPTILETKNIFDKFSVLSLTYRSNNFIRMLAPIRDYLCPRDPESSPHLCTTKDHYFTRLAVWCNPSSPGFGETRWIVSEDINVEHLLDVFTSTEPNTLGVWNACVGFMQHLLWQKPRQTVLRSKIEGLPDSHPSKDKCLFGLSSLFGSVGNYPEAKRHLIHTLTLRRERGDEFEVATTLLFLSVVNCELGLHREGIQQAEEALEIWKRRGNTVGQTRCLDSLARAFLGNNQLDAAEDTVLRNINLLQGEGQEFDLCRCHRSLGAIYSSKGEKEKAIRHLETAVSIATPFNWQHELFSVHFEMADLFRDGREFDDANTHIGQAKSHAANNPYLLGRGMQIQAMIWFRQCRLEDAMSEAMRALEIYERLGAAKDAGRCRELLQAIQRAMEHQLIQSESDPDARNTPHQKTLKSLIKRTGQIFHS